MTNYEIKLVKSRKGVIWLKLVAEAMARDDATLGGDRAFHRPTFDNMFKVRAADLLAAARSGMLVVCNSTGAENTADAIVMAEKKSMGPFTAEQLAYFEKDDTQLDMFYTTAKRLKEWRTNTDETFTVKEQPSEIVEYGDGRYRGEVAIYNRGTDATLSALDQTRMKWEIPDRLEFEARKIGKVWMDAERKAGRRPGVNKIAKHVEVEFKRLHKLGPRGDYWDWQTIKKEALTGLTGGKKNGK